MKIKIKLTITGWAYFLLAVVILLNMGITVYGQSVTYPIYGHSGDEISVTVDGEEKMLNDALDDLSTELETYTVNGNQINGLTPGRKYIVDVYGITVNRGEDNEMLNPIGVRECGGGAILDQAPQQLINWHDGNAPQSASFVVDAPASGCIEGYVDSGDPLYMNAVSIS